MDIFLSDSPVPFLLEDFYHTTHMPQKGPFVSKGLSCPQRFSSLSVDSIQWYKTELETKNIILNYEGFPNVPLIGTRGCINYNPVLCMRRFGHAMNRPPEDKDPMPFFIKDIDQINHVIRKVRKSWTKIVRSGPKLGNKNVITKEPYV